MPARATAGGLRHFGLRADGNASVAAGPSPSESLAVYQGPVLSLWSADRSAADTT